MDAEDVFDSVTWETPSATNGYDASYMSNADEGPTPPGKPGYLHHDDEGSAPNEPKWEGYLVAVVKDPVKELDGTKDMYVSYLVTAKVSLPVCSFNPANERHCRLVYPYSRVQHLRAAGAFRILSFYANTSQRTFPLVSFHHCLINTV